MHTRKCVAFTMYLFSLKTFIDFKSSCVTHVLLISVLLEHDNAFSYMPAVPVSTLNDTISTTMILLLTYYF